MKKATVIINEQHSLLKEQEQILLDKFESWELLKVPASGWTLAEQKRIAAELVADAMRSVTPVFASPVPALLNFVAQDIGYKQGEGWRTATPMVFHNDRREKKELSNGKVIMTVAAEGWELV